MGCVSSVDNCEVLVASSINDCKMPMSGQDANLIIESGIQNTERKNQTFPHYISLIVAKIAQSDQQRTAVHHWFWPYLLSKFNRYHLNNSQALELLVELKSLISTNFGLEQDKTISQIWASYGSNLHKLGNQILFQHKRAFEYCKFMAILKEVKNMAKLKYNQNFKTQLFFAELKYQLSLQQTLRVATKVRAFCQNDMNAFAFLSLYLQISVTKELEKGTFLQTVINKYDKIIYELEREYPPKLSQGEAYLFVGKAQLQNLQKQLQLGMAQHKMEKLVFNNQTRHYQQLEYFILMKAKHAASRKSQFIDFVKQIVREKGHSFKAGVKIQSSNLKTSLFRTIEKMYQQMYQQNMKIRPIKQIANANKKFTSDQLRKIIEQEKKEYQERVKLYFQQQRQTYFSASDLLRGKCTFDTVGDIYEAVKRMFIKIYEEKKKGRNIDLIEFKNRFVKPTRDLVIIIKFEESIAEFQFAYKSDLVSIEFNHKIYQLKRSLVYSPIINLFVMNEKWSQSFFTEVTELYENVLQLQDDFKFDSLLKFKDFRSSMEEFKKNILAKNGILSQKSSNQKENQAGLIKQKFYQLLNFIESNKKLNQKTMKTASQKINEVIFLQANFQYDKAMEILASINDGELMNSETLLEKKGDILKAKGKVQEAIKMFQRVIEIKKQGNFDEEISNIHMIFNKLGQVYYQKGDYSKALSYYDKCLEIKSKIKGPDSIEVAASLNNIGLVYYSKKDYKTALQYYQKCLNIRTKIKGIDSIDVAAILNNIGMVYDSKTDYQKGLVYYYKSLDIKTRLKGADSIDVASTLQIIGLVYQSKGDYNKALQCYNKCLKMRTKIKGTDSIDVASTLQIIWLVYYSKGNYSEALEYYNKCMEIRTKIKGTYSINVTPTMKDIGSVYKSKGDYNKALSYYDKCLEIETKIKGPDSIEVAASLNSIGQVYKSKGDYNKALLYYDKCLEVRTKAKGTNLIDVASTLNNIGQVYKSKGDYNKALEYYTKCLGIQTKVKGADSIEVASSLNNIKMIHQKSKGKYSIDVVTTSRK